MSIVCSVCTTLSYLFVSSFQLSDLFCSSQGTQTQSNETSAFQRLVKRMTRFWVKTTPSETEKYLTVLLERLQYTIKCKNNGTVSSFVLILL